MLTRSDLKSPDTEVLWDAGGSGGLRFMISHEMIAEMLVQYAQGAYNPTARVTRIERRGDAIAMVCTADPSRWMEAENEKPWYPGECGEVKPPEGFWQEPVDFGAGPLTPEEVTRILSKKGGEVRAAEGADG